MRVFEEHPEGDDVDDDTLDIPKVPVPARHRTPPRSVEDLLSYAEEAVTSEAARMPAGVGRGSAVSDFFDSGLGRGLAGAAAISAVGTAAYFGGGGFFFNAAERMRAMQGLGGAFRKQGAPQAFGTDYS